MAPVELELDLGDEGKIRIIDTPGWEFAEEEPDQEEDEVKGEGGDEKWDMMEDRIAGDLLRRNLGRIDKVKDVFPLGSCLSQGFFGPILIDTPFI